MIPAWVHGMIGVTIFAGSLPATRVAVRDFDPFFLTSARAVIAGLVALVLLRVWHQPRPRRADLGPLLVVAGGVVLGFPLLSAMALQYVTSAHATVFVGLMPVCTALFAVIRAGERPRPAFWVFSLLGGLCVTVHAALQGGIDGSLAGDLLMLASIIVCGLGYAEGARLSRSLGGWQVICWALVVSLPLMLVAAVLTAPPSFAHVSLAAWTGLAYVSLFSMLIGFIFWYRGLVQGGIAAVGQLQLLQPFIALALAALLLHETVNPAMLITTTAAVGCVIGARRYAR